MGVPVFRLANPTDLVNRVGLNGFLACFDHIYCVIMLTNWGLAPILVCDETWTILDAYFGGYT